MHKHTIDWLRQVHLTADAPLAEKRWATAAAAARQHSRPRVISLLKLFLFPQSDSSFSEQFSNELLELDAEFPVSENIQELRLMAGLVMMVNFEDSDKDANAFALGLRAATFPDGRAKPIQPAILTVAEEYLRRGAARLRPNDFSIAILPDAVTALSAETKAVDDAETTDGEADASVASSRYRDSVSRAIDTSHRVLAKRLEQLAEESALLWWVLAEYSDALQQPVDKLTPEAYALAAAAEAAGRTTQSLPPPSIGPLLVRALRPCKGGEGKLVLSDYFKASDSHWRAAHVKSIDAAGCDNLTPLSAMLKITEELGSSATALKTLPKLCPGVRGNLPLTPPQAAQQFYNELMFLRALDASMA